MFWVKFCFVEVWDGGEGRMRRVWERGGRLGLWGHTVYTPRWLSALLEPQTARNDQVSLVKRK